MASSSSHATQVQSTQNDVSSIILLGEDLKPAGKFMSLTANQLVLLEDKPVDFENLKLNGFDIEPLIEAQGWKKYFDILNGPVYSRFVKDFWIKNYAFDEEYCKKQEKMMLETNPSLKGQTRYQMGLEPYIEDEIRSNFGGINFVIKREHIARLLGLESKGARLHTFGKYGTASLRDSVTQAIMKDGTYVGDQEARMKDMCRVIYRIIVTPRFLKPKKGIVFFFKTTRKTFAERA
ncbi:hypothetical protein A2U01_0016741 [Trifolium medium]|uniref:Cullin-like protein n=1 Tax=Trifolium medium TaxID=97028 RepID=A0A392N973_9FABA|nr:hypothetical protein [Trifolium medium]